MRADLFLQSPPRAAERPRPVRSEGGEAGSSKRPGGGRSGDAVTDDLFWEAGGAYRPSDHPVVALFARQRVAHLDAVGALDGVTTLLDVGAGSGFSSRYYPASMRVVACDYAAGMLRGNPVADRLRCAAGRLPFPDRTFDAVAVWELLHHLDDPVAALREMARVARRRLILFEPNRVNPGHIVLGLTRPSERRSLRFSPRYLRGLVERAGLAVARQERCGLIFPNVTPLWAAAGLSQLPFRAPLIGISQLVVVEVPPAAAGRG
jgi:SAM-dependent methyltransferase